MVAKIDPFTLTPGVAGKPYIDMGIADEIIANFKSDESCKYVYKITGLRGSGKSVEYSRVLQYFEKEDNWLVYPLSAEGSGVGTLISYLSREDFIDNKKITISVGANASAEGKLAVLSGHGGMDITRTSEENANYYDAEAALSDMIATANKKNYKILIMIDDISKTRNMVELLSIVGTMFNRGRQVYLVVSGLAKNIEDFTADQTLSKSLSFFRRGDTREVKALDKFDIVNNYEKFLKINAMEAKKLYDMTLGYAYAYQVLGSLYFNKNKADTIDDLIPDYERTLFKTYDLDWPKLSDGEQDFIKNFYQGKTGLAKDTKAHMKNPSSYNVYRDRLIDKHFFVAEKRGYLSSRLPRFDRYIQIWCSD